MRTETLSLVTAKGPTTAYVAMPDGPNDNAARAVLVIQEYWGLNDHIRDICGRYADEGFIAISPDLYRGRLATTSDEAATLMQSLPLDDGIDTINNAIGAAREKYTVRHFGISGYCMGGTYALRAACLLEGISAAAPFYGDTPEED